MGHRRGIIAGTIAALLSMGLLTVGSAFGASDPGSSSGAKTYRWVDAQGIVHYGDSVPSEYSQSDRSVLNNQGVEVEHVQGSKNAAQQAAQAQADIVAAHDRFLLTTYVSTKDIEQLRDERVGLMEAQIKSAMTYIDTLSARLGALQDRAMRFKPYNSEPNALRMPDDLAEELVRTLNETRTQHQALDAKRREQSDTQAQFDRDIQRYNELKAPRPHN